ncbi:MAG: hypothetical protein R2695_19100 [Acidimicrobiales bacterium]
MHTRAGGLAAGYGGAVVAGTTVYAYLTRPAAAAWGLDWLGMGRAEVRFLGAVLEGDATDVIPVAGDGDWRIEARHGGDVRAVAVVGIDDRPPPTEPQGDRLEPLVVTLDDRWVGYAERAGEDLVLYREHDLVHPVVWPALANRMFALQLVDGPWVHTRSAIRHVGLARPGATALVEAFLTDRFDTPRRSAVATMSASRSTVTRLPSSSTRRWSRSDLVEPGRGTPVRAPPCGMASTCAWSADDDSYGYCPTFIRGQRAYQLRGAQSG